MRYRTTPSQTCTLQPLLGQEIGFQIQVTHIFNLPQFLQARVRKPLSFHFLCIVSAIISKFKDSTCYTGHKFGLEALNKQPLLSIGCCHQYLVREPKFSSSNLSKFYPQSPAVKQCIKPNVLAVLLLWQHQFSSDRSFLEVLTLAQPLNKKQHKFSKCSTLDQKFFHYFTNLTCFLLVLNVIASEP